IARKPERCAAHARAHTPPTIRDAGRAGAVGGAGKEGVIEPVRRPLLDSAGCKSRILRHASSTVGSARSPRRRSLFARLSLSLGPTEESWDRFSGTCASRPPPLPVLALPLRAPYRGGGPSAEGSFPPGVLSRLGRDRPHASLPIAAS